MSVSKSRTPAYRQGYRRGYRRALWNDDRVRWIQELETQLHDLKTKRAQEYAKFCLNCQRVVQDLRPMVDAVLEDLKHT